MACIFCKKDSKNSKSVEHIIPEALGSKRLILPKGFVCDRCNNYFSIKIERQLMAHPSFRNIRGMYQVLSKKGEMPSVLGTLAGDDIEISMKLDKEGNLDIQPENEKSRNKLKAKLHRMYSEKDFNPMIFNLDINPPKKLMSKLLAKMAFEFLVYRFKDNNQMVEYFVNSKHHDLIRDYARVGNNFDFWPYHIRRIFPIETQMLHPETKKMVMFGFGYDLFLNHRKETYFIFLYYGVEFVINIGGTSRKGYEEWLKLNNNISPILERNGGKVVKENINGKDKFVIRGEYCPNIGIMYDKNLIERTVN